jgi:hypothetical protein
MSAVIRNRGLLGTSMVLAVLGTTAACGSENAPAAQPAPTSTAPSAATSLTPPASTPEPGHGGSPSKDCPDPISVVRAAVEKATWGKGAQKSLFRPISVTICQYDAMATGQDYATSISKRTAKRATDLFALVNDAKVPAHKPKYCTQDLGPTYVLRFIDKDRGVLSYAAEAFGCRRLVAISFEGRGKPRELAAPRHASPALLKALHQR